MRWQVRCTAGQRAPPWSCMRAMAGGYRCRDSSSDGLRLVQPSCHAHIAIRTHSTLSLDQLRLGGREPSSPRLLDSQRDSRLSVLLGASQAGGKAGPVSWL